MIYVECKPDFALVRSLTNITRRGIIHTKGKGEICNQLRKRSGCKGLVDEDPLSIQPPYMREARLENNLPQHDLKLLHDDTNNNYLIVLCPRLEEWVLKAAQEDSKDVTRYNLPNNGIKLHQQININLDRFEDLLEDLKGSSSRLKTLKRLLERG